MIPIVHDWRRSFRGRRHDLIAAFWSCRAPVAFQTKEHPAIPAYAGDPAGDRRERFVGAPLILEIVAAHGDAVLDALPFPHQPGAGDRSAFGPPLWPPAGLAVILLSQRPEPFDGLVFQA